MVQGNNSESVLSSATAKLSFGNNTTRSLQLADGSVETLHLPLRYAGGDLGLGLGTEPWIDIVDASGRRYLTHSVEWVLKNIDLFKAGRDQVSLLAGAALHYGLDGYALMGADFNPMWSVLDASGNVLLAGVAHSTASDFVDEYAKTASLHAEDGCDLRIRRISSSVGNRHEGPLSLLHHNLGVTTFTGIAVKSLAGRCAMMLEEVLRRLDQFGAADQDELLAGLAKHFDLAQNEMAGAA